MYYYHDDTLVGRKDYDGKKYFYHPDHLGSTDLITDEQGNVVEKTDYLPYGETFSGGNDRFLYTGKEKDSDTGLYYYGARYYDPSLTNFIQPDSIIPNVYNPQSLNRYSYVERNPYKYVDPEGKWIELVYPTIELIVEVISPLVLSILYFKEAKKERESGKDKQLSEPTNIPEGQGVCEAIPKRAMMNAVRGKETGTSHQHNVPSESEVEYARRIYGKQPSGWPGYYPIQIDKPSLDKRGSTNNRDFITIKETVKSTVSGEKIYEDAQRNQYVESDKQKQNDKIIDGHKKLGY